MYFFFIAFNFEYTYSMQSLDVITFKTIELLIITYANPLFIPTDIIYIIKNYYTLASSFHINTFLLQFVTKESYGQINKSLPVKITLQNLWSHKEYDINTHDNAELCMCADSWYHDTNTYCIANNIPLPKFLQNTCIKDNDPLQLTNTLMSTNWSVIFRCYEEIEIIESLNTLQRVSTICNSLTAFNKQLISNNKCFGYNFKLPSLTDTSAATYWSERVGYSLVYSKRNNILYNVSHLQIYSLNFNDESDWKWNDMNANLSRWRKHTSLCMVDND
eukprot:91695_1